MTVAPSERITSITSGPQAVSNESADIQLGGGWLLENPGVSWGPIPTILTRLQPRPQCRKPRMRLGPTD